ncbi:unnamed protein product [Malus baccata var. baccata]|uniref:Ubiquinol-cytochrome c reductase complex 6.7 kDa protein n=2 Tax=Malus TaxID=3749 RepID=A0A498KMF8_MALDO|nr:hypothetical protein DVH24_022831 [Malus domestica]TQD74206.1 hypothetical protein C1H46_040271 [Malus baccata]
MAGELSMFKFVKPRLRPHTTDLQAAVGWGVAAFTGALWLVQPFDWIRKTFIEKPEPEAK